MAKKTYKSRSGKHGTLMQTAADPDFGKDTRGDFKGKILLASGEPLSEELKEAQRQEWDMKLQASYDKHKAIEFEVDHYNENLEKLDKDYQGIDVKNYLIARMMHSPVVKNGMFVGNKIYKPHRSEKQGQSNEFQDHPFPFEPIGVVVTSDVEGYNSGDIILVRDTEFRLTWNPVDWQYEMHNQFRLPWDARKISGYMLIGQHSIIGKIDKPLTEIWEKIKKR